ncbi:MAG: 4-(cytidine 5'-diphospho)-2-C-methyl-D-erythritol kinase [Cognatishimia sp.]
MTAKVTAFAPAKLNLTLHVTGRRSDGYHVLDSLVVFADVGDQITAELNDTLSLNINGPMALGVPSDASNLMLKAAALMPLEQGAALSLTKNLPAASGIGGGSSDAAATLRALSQLWNVPLPTSEMLLKLGADLPVCMTPLPQRMSGIGEKLSLVPNVPELNILLVNPKTEVPTPAVFKAMTNRDNPGMTRALPAWSSQSDFVRWLGDQRNDMQAAACALAPEISNCLTALEAVEGCQLARMSGSGATCIGVFVTVNDAKAAELALKSIYPNWWVTAAKTTAS